jgi:tetratricopeptide (TPR) repeat protein
MGSLSRWIGIGGNGFEATGFFTPLGAIVLAFLPAMIAVRAFAGFGSFGVLMRSEYLSLLMCTLIAWAAAYLPVALVLWLVHANLPWLFAAANVYFVVLVILSVRTSLGIGLASAMGLALLGCVAGIVGLAVSDVGGSMRYYLMSPFLLYYGYSFFVSDFRALGDGLRSRQHLRRQLEIATNNPRDADAHYQLGLIYQKRRQFTEAIARFERAVSIDPGEADPHLQLGRVALEQGRFTDAVPLFEKAAALDDKASSSEVWRDLGAAYLNSSRPEQAAAALSKYADRRPYDPEGLYWLGKTLSTLGRNGEARARFEECVEAVRTAPGHRRAHIRKWSSQAKSALKAVK